MSAQRLFVAWWCFLLGLMALGFDVARWTISGVFLLGVVLLVVWAWGIGGFTRAFWFEEDPYDELTGLDRADRERRP